MGIHSKKRWVFLPKLLNCCSFVSLCVPTQWLRAGLRYQILVSLHSHSVKKPRPLWDLARPNFFHHGFIDWNIWVRYPIPAFIEKNLNFTVYYSYCNGPLWQQPLCHTWRIIRQALHHPLRIFCIVTLTNTRYRTKTTQVFRLWQTCSIAVR